MSDSGLSPDQLAVLARNSRKSGYLTGFGAVLLLCAFAYSGYQLSVLNNTIADKQQLIEDKSKQLEAIDSSLERLQAQELSLNQQIDVLRTQKDGLLADLKSLGQQHIPLSANESALPLSALVSPQADAVSTGQRARNGRPIRDYTLWLDVPQSRIKEIEKVIYYFNHPTFPQKTQKTSDWRNAFRVGYRGWGCLYRVAITLVLVDGSRREMDFNMCNALGVS